MTTATRRELLRVLEELSEAIPTPEYRLGQMIANLALHARGAEPSGVWNVEDDELLAAAREDLEIWRRRAREEERSLGEVAS